MRFRPLAVFAFVSASLLLVSFDSPRAQRDSAKIDPWVIEHTEGKQQAEFLVILRDQADLSGAEALSTKTDKGFFV